MRRTAMLALSTILVGRSPPVRALTVSLMARGPLERRVNVPSSFFNVAGAPRRPLAPPRKWTRALVCSESGESAQSSTPTREWDLSGLRRECERGVLRQIKKVGKAEARLSRAQEEGGEVSGADSAELELVSQLAAR